MKFLLKVSLLLFLFSSCEKNVEDNLAGHTWSYEATYTINSGAAEVINAKGTFTFNKDFTGKQTESEQFNWDFKWSTSSKYVAIDYESGGSLTYKIITNTETNQEWSTDANYVYEDNSSFPATIYMKLSRN